jgi:AcrR family transcriptional regulator
VSARDRLLGKACELFYKEGIQAVGIQRLIDEAGIAKASLYAHFASKDELVAAYLKERAGAWEATLKEKVLDSALMPREKLLKIFDVQAELIQTPGYRGCPFQNAGGELADASHPARVVAAAHRDWLKATFTRLVKEAGAAHPAAVAGAILVLFDGAAASAMVEGNASTARHARWAAEQLLDAALPGQPSRRSASHPRH